MAAISAHNTLTGFERIARLFHSVRWLILIIIDRLRLLLQRSEHLIDHQPQNTAREVFAAPNGLAVKGGVREHILVPSDGNENERALQLLTDPDLVQRYLTFFHRIYIGRTTELLRLLLAIISRRFSRGISVIVTGTSSVGKTTLVETILTTVAPEDVVDCRAKNRNWLQQTSGLAHKIVLLGADLVTTGLTLAELDQATEGMVLVSTSTSDVVDPELATRVMVIEVSHDDDIARQVYVLRAHRAAYIGHAGSDGREPFIAAATLAEPGNGSSAHGDDEVHIFQAADRLLEPVEVAIPYAVQLAELYPTGQERFTRDFEQLLQLIRASALLHQYQRRRDRRGRIIATRQDYALVYNLGEFVHQSYAPAPPRLLEFLNAIKRNENHATREQVQQTLCVSLATIKRFVNAGVANDWIRAEGRGRKQRLTLIDEPPGVSPLPAPESIDDEL